MKYCCRRCRLNILEARHERVAIIERRTGQGSRLVSVKFVVPVAEALEHFTTSRVGFKGDKRHVERWRVKLNL
jgi:hypothetical protein